MFDRTVPVRTRLPCLFVLLMCTTGAAVPADQIRIASWNLNNLHYEAGVPLRKDAPERTEVDYRVLRKYAKRLNADIIALQEVNGPQAAKRVFPDHDLYFSTRYGEDLLSDQSSDRIYTGFAVRPGAVEVMAVTSHR